MEREFGKIRKGEEETYAMLLLPMEGNVLKIHREFPGANSRRLREAIALALFDVNMIQESLEIEKMKCLKGHCLWHLTLIRIMR